MRRIAIILAVWISVVLAVGAGYVAVEGELAAKRGKERYLYRRLLQDQLARVRTSRPDVVWMGDSTILSLGVTSYPQILKGVLPDATSAAPYAKSSSTLLPP